MNKISATYIFFFVGSLGESNPTTDFRHYDTNKISAGAVYFHCKLKDWSKVQSNNIFMLSSVIDHITNAMERALAHTGSNQMQEINFARPNLNTSCKCLHWRPNLANANMDMYMEGTESYTSNIVSVTILFHFRCHFDVLCAYKRKRAFQWSCNWCVNKESW